MAKYDLPEWSAAGLLGMTEAAFQSELERLEFAVRSAEMIADTPPFQKYPL